MLTQSVVQQPDFKKKKIENEHPLSPEPELRKKIQSK